MRTRDPWSPPQTPFRLAHVAPMGVTSRKLESAVRDGSIVRLRHGVYVASAAVPEDPVALHLLRALADQVAAPDRVASHETAALALGLPLADTLRAAGGPTHHTRPPVPHERARRGRQHRVHLAALPDHHVVTLPSGLVVTTAARTAIDVASQVDLPAGLMIVDAAARVELAALAGPIHRRLYRDARLGAAAVRPLLEAMDTASRRTTRRRLVELSGLWDVRRESPLESFSAGHMHLCGIPAPKLQVRIRTSRGDHYPDYLWEEYRLVGEADGEGKYRDESAYTFEKIREESLRDDGWAMVRWTGREVFGSPPSVMDRIQRALRGRGWPG